MDPIFFLTLFLPRRGVAAPCNVYKNNIAKNVSIVVFMSLYCRLSQKCQKEINSLTIKCGSRHTTTIYECECYCFHVESKYFSWINERKN